MKYQIILNFIKVLPSYKEMTSIGPPLLHLFSGYSIAYAVSLPDVSRKLMLAYNQLQIEAKLHCNILPCWKAPHSEHYAENNAAANHCGELGDLYVYCYKET